MTKRSPARKRRLVHARGVLTLALLLVLASGCSASDEPTGPSVEAGDAAEEPRDKGPDDDADAPASADEGDDAVQPTPTPDVVAHPRVDPSDFQAGIAVLIYGNEEPEAFADKTRRVLDRLVGLGANSVSVVFPLYQDGWRATEVSAHPERTPSEDRLRHFVQEAGERQLTVMLRPILDEESLMADGQWRGSIQPADPDAWFASYGEVLVSYATLAAEEGVEILTIGSELTSLQGEDARWNALIEDVRAVYDGELVYAANFDAIHPDFAEGLEWQGIDAFYPLDAPEDATVSQLEAAWEPWLREIENAGAPLEEVVFTEIGVRAQAGAHRRPYVWDHGSPADEEAQRRYYEAACRSLVPHLGGIYWWKVDFDFPDEAQEPEAFSPLGKPAEEALADCFRDIGAP